jgi:hypothetical protein
MLCCHRLIQEMKALLALIQIQLVPIPKHAFASENEL